MPHQVGACAQHDSRFSIHALSHPGGSWPWIIACHPYLLSRKWVDDLDSCQAPQLTVTHGGSDGDHDDMRTITLYVFVDVIYVALSHEQAYPKRLTLWWPTYMRHNSWSAAVSNISWAFRALEFYTSRVGCLTYRWISLGWSWAYVCRLVCEADAQGQCMAVTYIATFIRGVKDVAVWGLHDPYIRALSSGNTFQCLHESKMTKEGCGCTQRRNSWDGLWFIQRLRHCSFLFCPSTC